MTGRAFSEAGLAALRLRAKGAGRKMKGQCALCHGKESGVAGQGFPVEKGVIEVGGYRICTTHAARLVIIAAAAGLQWSPGGIDA